MFTTSLSRVTHRSGRLRRLVATAVAVPLAVLGMVVVTAPAAQAASAVAVATTTGGFPLYYQDNATTGTRLEPCFNGADTRCVLPAAGAEPNFNPGLPTVFPTNFPSEFFYAYAQSTKVPTPGCNGTAAGTAFVTLALEGAFIGGAPKAGDQQVFGRVRIRVTSGLCANRAYSFRHPFGTTTVTTDGAGAVPANATGATTDVGCLAPTITTPCNFNQALSSPVLGGTTGFLRWSAANPQPPVGYLGDGVTPHPIVGANGPNSANSFTVTGPNAANQNVTIGTTTNFVVAGKVAGPLVSTPSTGAFGTVAVGANASTTFTVRNLNSTTYRVNRANQNPTGVTVTGAGAAQFSVTATTCPNTPLAIDAACTVTVRTAPNAAGAAAATLNVNFGGGPLSVRSPLTVPLSVTGVAAGAPVVSVAPNPVAFGNVRIRETATVQATVTNTGNAPLGVTATSFTGANAGQFTVTDTTCTTTPVAPGGTCTVDVLATPALPAGAKTANLVLTSNVAGGTTTVPVTMTATGGVAAVSTEFLPIDGFPTWYRDENGVKLQQCIDPSDPYCVVLPDATYIPGQPLKFLPTDATPVNFPGEFFYTVADSDLLTTPGCNGTAAGTSAYRSAIEGTFVNGEPVDTEQMVFGRERFFVTSGLCPGQTYTVTTPYGVKTDVADAAGGLKRTTNTTDIGCVPVAPATCAWDEALSSPVAGGFLRWDPAQVPAAPAGYIGDAATLHRVVGAPYLDGGTPANYFRIEGPGLPPGGISTNQFTVMGKLQGPLEATAGLTAGTLVLAATPVGATSAAKTVTLTNTGIANIVVGAVTTTGTDAAEFTVVPGANTCTGATLAPAGTCTLDVTFAPTATGVRSASLNVVHDGLNNPFVVPVQGTGEAVVLAPAISFSPRSLAFGQLAVGNRSSVQTVVVSNAGGKAPLTVSGIVSGSASFAIAANRCGQPVPIDGTCSFDLVFAPTAGGPLNATITVTDDAPGGTHTVSVSGAGFAGGKAVSATTDQFGFPRWYQDGNGVRLEPCLQAANCPPPAAGFDPTQPLSLADNFPDEFFYAFADSELATVAPCNVGDPTGTALLRLAQEGSFSTPTPDANGAITFNRIRLLVSGLCPNVANYRAVTPYGEFTFATDGNGDVVPTADTQDTGCGAAPCNFAAALGSPGAVWNVGTPIDGFLRVDPGSGVTPPAGFIGDGLTLTKVTGGTYVKQGDTGAFNGFQILDPGGLVKASTNKFVVAGKLAGPLNTSTASLDFGNVDQGQQSATQTVTVTNVGSASTGVTPALAGASANQYTITGGTCAAGNSLAQDGTCTVVLRFTPTLTATGAKDATLVLTPVSGPTATVALTGVANVVAQPAIAVSTGVLSYNTVTAPNSAPATFTITNPGGLPLVVDSAAIAGSGAADFALTSSTCPAGPAPAKWTIQPGAVNACTVTVTFTPKAIGARTGTLTLTHNAAGTTTVVSLTGTGAGAAWSVSPNPVGFGTVNRGSSKTSTLSVRNTGTANATMSAAGTTVVGQYFGVVVNPATSTCFNGTAVAPGRTCSISVTFSPAANAVVGGFSGTLNIDGGASSLPRITSIPMTATTR
jgi:hypothetical protein